jgi:membrane-associated phospholipid phosphatase
VLSCAAGLSASSVAAQADAGDAAPETVLRASDVALFAAFTAGSMALSRLDTRVAYWFRDTARQGNETMHAIAYDATQIHETRLTLAALLVYGIGRLTQSEAVADIGWHTAEAVVATSVVCQVIRGPLGRSRPSRSGLDDPYDFHFLRGFREFDYRAFPSIHASGAFAAATVLVAETARRNPNANWVVAPLSFAFAAAPGYARMYLAQHWASDVFMGAFFGVFYGARVVDYNHDHPDNRFDRFFLGRVPTEGIRLDYRGGKGATLSYGLTF